MEKNKYLSLDGLTQYDALIKAQIDSDIENHTHSWNNLEDRPFYVEASPVEEYIIEHASPTLTVTSEQANNLYNNYQDYDFYMAGVLARIYTTSTSSNGSLLNIKFYEIDGSPNKMPGSITINLNNNTISGIYAGNPNGVPTKYYPVRIVNKNSGEIIHKIDEKFLPEEILVGRNVGNGAEIFNSYEKNIATGEYSHAEGWGTQASGFTSHAEGMQARATGYASHAEGGHNKASEMYSHAEGYFTEASETASHAEGYYTIASGNYGSHAEGHYAEAAGKASHAEGSNTIASGEYQHAQGKYNIEDTENKYAHIVGNGDGDASRSNAHTIDWDGNAWFAGDVYTGGANQDEGSKLITEIEVDTKISAIDTSINNITSGTTVVKNAEHATNADEATHATSADTATHATQADSSTNADNAVKATQDANGNVISDTYETKTDASAKLTEAKEYTDTKIADLVNSAPETLDTLGELATAMQENADVVNALDAAITNKADKEHTHNWNDVQEKPFEIVEGDAKVLIDNQPFALSSNGSADFAGWMQSVEFGEQTLEYIALKEGRTYSMTINGVTYTGVCALIGQTYYVGNLIYMKKIFGQNVAPADDTGEDFLLSVMIDDDEVKMMLICVKGEPIDDTTITIVEYPVVEKFNGVIEYENILNKPTKLSEFENDLNIVTSWNDLEDKPFGEVIELVEFCNGTFSFSVGSGSTGSSIAGSEPLWDYDARGDFEPGKEVKVTFDGEVYNCITKTNDMFGVVVGNESIMNGFGSGFSFEDTGEPFLIYACYMTTNNIEAETHDIVVSVPEETIKKLDSKFLPDGIETFVVTITEESGTSEPKSIDKTYAEIKEAYDKGQNIICVGKATGDIYTLNSVVSDGVIFDANRMGGHAGATEVVVYGYMIITPNDELVYMEDQLAKIEVLQQLMDLVQLKQDNNLTTTSKEIVGAINELNTKASTQSDWSVNDETNPSYIKNRPFYSDIQNFELFDGDCDFALEESLGLLYIGVITPTVEGDVADLLFNLGASGSLDGQNFNVVYDGVEYSLTGKSIPQGISYIGNDSLLNDILGVSFEDTGEPFIITIPDFMVCTTSTESNHKIAINWDYETIVTIPNKYIDLGLSIKNGLGENSVLLNDVINNSANGSNSFAEGEHTTASGDSAHAEGSYTEASGNYSHTEGYNTEASGSSAHAEGNYTEASGDYSHAEGSITIASGFSAHSEGTRTKASYRYSHAEGLYTEAIGQSQHVQGEYNILDTAPATIYERAKYAHIVGNGTAENKRSNAHTIDWEGNAEYAGDVIANACGGENPVSLVELNTKVNELNTNKLDVPTELDALELVMEMGLVELAASEDGSIYINENGKAYTL